MRSAKSSPAFSACAVTTEALFQDMMLECMTKFVHQNSGHRFICFGRSYSTASAAGCNSVRCYVDVSRRCHPTRIATRDYMTWNLGMREVFIKENHLNRPVRFLKISGKSSGSHTAANCSRSISCRHSSSSSGDAAQRYASSALRYWAVRLAGTECLAGALVTVSATKPVV